MARLSPSASGVANAGGQATSAGKEKNALYVAGHRHALTTCCKRAFSMAAGAGCNNCGLQPVRLLSDCCCCDCSTTVIRLEMAGMVHPRRNTPPLVTTSDPADAGFWGAPSTRVLYATIRSAPIFATAVA